jgi:hypothetical protein
MALAFFTICKIEKKVCSTYKEDNEIHLYDYKLGLDNNRLQLYMSAEVRLDSLDKDNSLQSIQ